MNWGSRHQSQQLDTRITIFRFVLGAVFIWLLSAFWHIQIQSNDYYLIKAQQNKFKDLPITAPRGNIFDRNGRVLVTNGLIRSAVIDPLRFNQDSLALISEKLGIPHAQTLELINEVREYPGTMYLTLKKHLTIEDITYLQSTRKESPDIDIVETVRRQYPQTGIAVHLLGYVGKASKIDLNRREFLLSNYRSEIGKNGIERQYHHWLTGKDGYQRFLVDNMGRQLEMIQQQNAVAGKDLKLTIDIDLQAVSELALEGRKGAIVAIDPRNGEVLAMASAPTYDANMFVMGFSDKEWQLINDDPETQMLNRAIQGTWAMGSVFKPIMALAGLETGNIEDFTVFCKGGLAYGGRYFRCHNHSGHGKVELQKAIEQSCDVYFYLLGDKLGINTIERYARRAGLGKRTMVDLPDEMPGFVPSIQWKVRELQQPWFPAETIIVSIGQGAMAVTPLQVAYSIGGLAMGGVWHKPRLISREQSSAMPPYEDPPDAHIDRINPQHHNIIRDAMWKVVNGSGTGRQARLSNIEVCGKTGTSQRVSNRTRLNSGREDFEDDAWFVGFTPCKDPEIVVAVLLENGKYSYLAAAVAREIIKVWNTQSKTQLNARQSLQAANSPRRTP